MNKKVLDVIKLTCCASFVVFGGFMLLSQTLRTKKPLPPAKTLDHLCEKEIEAYIPSNEKILQFTHIYSGYRMPISRREFKFNIVSSKDKIKIFYDGKCLWNAKELRVTLVSLSEPTILK